VPQNKSNSVSFSVGRNADCVMKRSEIASSTTVECSSASVWTSHSHSVTPGVSGNSHRVGTRALTRPSGNGADSLDTFANMSIPSTSVVAAYDAAKSSSSSCLSDCGIRAPVTKSYSSSLLAGRTVDSAVKRPAVAVLTTVGQSSASAWTSSVPRMALRLQRNQQHVALAGNGANSLDNFADPFTPQTGRLSVSYV